MVSSRTWPRVQLSNDPTLEEKVIDVVGWYLESPEKAGVPLPDLVAVIEMSVIERYSRSTTTRPNRWSGPPQQTPS